jgi:type I restriction enzyme S subunit
MVGVENQNMDNKGTLNFDLPGRWSLVELREICHKITDGTHKTPNYIDSGVRFISIKNIKPFKPIDWNSYIKFISREEHEELIQRCNPEYDDILFPRIGTLGFAKRIDFKEEVSIFVGLGLLKPIREIVLPKYLEYWMNHPLINKLSHEKATGTGRLTLPLAESRKFPIPIAPINEQKRIVAEIEKQFSRLDEAVENIQRVKANLKRYKASFLNAAVEGKLTRQWRNEHPDVEPASELLKRILKERFKKWEKAELAKLKAKGKGPKDDRWKKRYKKPIEPSWNNYPELPSNWTWATIEQLASDEPRSIQSGPFGSNLKHSEFQKEGKLVIGIDNVQDGYFSTGSENRISEKKFKELEKYAARPCDVLITVMATIGRTCLVPKNLETAIITKHVYRITPNKRIVNPEFLHLTLWGSAFVKEQINRQVIGQTRPGLNGTIVRRLIIPVPPLEEQNLILESIKADLSLVDNTYPIVLKQEKRSVQLRRSVLEKAFSGKLVPSDPSDEPASYILERIKKKVEDQKIIRRPAKVKRGKRLMKIDADSVKKAIKNLPDEGFTFDELRDKVRADYDTLQNIVFTLLESEKPVLKQVFNETEKKINFIRVKK